MSAKQQRKPHIIIFICIKMTRHYKRVVKKTRSISILDCIFRRIGPFSNFHFQEKKIMNKWPHVAFRFFYIIILQFAKSHKAIASILRPQKELKIRSRKKSTLYTKMVGHMPWLGAVQILYHAWSGGSTKMRGRGRGWTWYHIWTALYINNHQSPFIGPIGIDQRF